MIFKVVNSDELNKEVSGGKDTRRSQDWALESAEIEKRERSQGNREEAGGGLAGAHKELCLEILVLRKKSWLCVSNVAKT